MHKTKVSRAVALLEKRKLLPRPTAPTCASSSCRSPSAGRAMYEELAPHALDFTRKLTEILSPGDRDAFDRALKRLTDRSAELVAEAVRENGWPDGGRVKLYSYFRSSAAYRVRIALNLKGIAYETAPIHLIKDGGHNKRPEFRAINPQMRVPVLVHAGRRRPDPVARHHRISRRDPSANRRCCRKDPLARAKVRALAELIACDIHPLNNTGPLRYLKKRLGPGAKRDRCLVPPLGHRRASRRSKR